MVGSAPASLIIDALVEGGAHGEAFQLASELPRRHPNDPVAMLKLASVLVWLGRRDEVATLARDALTRQWRTVIGSARLMEWASNVDPVATVTALTNAVNDPWFALERTALQQLLNRATTAPDET